MKKLMRQAGRKGRHAMGSSLLCALALLIAASTPARGIPHDAGVRALQRASDDPALPACGLIHAKLVQTGVASWYGPKFHGRLTANGEVYDMNKLSAAHRTLPLNTEVRVTNEKNGESVVLRINDRGPYVHGRILDLSLGAAKALDMRDKGLAKVKIQVLCRHAPTEILLTPPRKPTSI